ncbi:MAG: hypothetical protein H0T50_13970 [Gemmatimonadales bacterium]|nr:hypothetical protein [Gemmatimonadales bacterium]
MIRGAEPGQRVMFSYVDLEQRIPGDHPLRAIQALVEPVLQGLVVATTVSAPGGTAEVDQAIELCATQPPRAGRRTLGADLGYDQRSLSILDGRTTRHAGYATSQQRRKRVEESFGWSKTVGLLRKLRHRGLALVD